MGVGDIRYGFDIGYIGVDLIWRFIKDGLAWWYVALGSAFIVVAVIFLIVDVRHYVRLKKHLKEKDAAEVDETDASKENVDVTREVKGTSADGQEMSGVRSFAKYVVKDEEVDSDDEV